MFKLTCKAQNYAWGKVGLESVVGEIHNHHFPEQSAQTATLPFAEYWMGDHPNGPSMIKVDKSDNLQSKIVNNSAFMEEHDGKTIPMSKLFTLDRHRFMGPKFIEKFGERDIPYLFKVLSVRTALSI